MGSATTSQGASTTNPKQLWLTAEKLRSILHYDSNSGVFTWLIGSKKGGRWKAGNVAGTIDSDGYRAIRIDGYGFRAHRLAWLYVYSEWPTVQIDHKNLIYDDNRIDNLRIATPSLNRANTPKANRNTSGAKGVFYDDRKNPWRARITVNGQQIGLGSFATIEEAREVYASAAQKYFGEYARS